MLQMYLFIYFYIFKKLQERSKNKFSIKIVNGEKYIFHSIHFQKHTFSSISIKKSLNNKTSQLESNDNYLCCSVPTVGTMN